MVLEIFWETWCIFTFKQVCTFSFDTMSSYAFSFLYKLLAPALPHSEHDYYVLYDTTHKQPKDTVVHKLPIWNTAQVFPQINLHAKWPHKITIYWEPKFLNTKDAVKKSFMRRLQNIFFLHLHTSINFAGGSILTPLVKLNSACATSSLWGLYSPEV
jgi:hypothetical protein